MSLSMLIAPITSIIDKLIPDKQAAAAAKIKLVELEQSGDLAELNAMVEMNKGQMGINKQEAAHKSLFVAGWRPFIGWVCGIGLAWEFVGFKVASFAVQASGSTLAIPTVTDEKLMELTLAMLGMGALRTYEKLKGKAREK